MCLVFRRWRETLDSVFSLTFVRCVQFVPICGSQNSDSDICFKEDDVKTACQSQAAAEHRYPPLIISHKNRKKITTQCVLFDNQKIRNNHEEIVASLSKRRLSHYR